MSSGALDAEIAEASLIAWKFAVARLDPWRKMGFRHVCADDLVQEALLKMVDGTREWDPRRGSMSLFLCQTIRSLLHSARKTHARATRRNARELDDPCNPRAHASPEEEFAEAEDDAEVMREVFEAAGDDEALRQLAAAVRLGAFKREQIAEDVGWSVNMVTAARIKLQRRLRKLFPRYANRGIKRPCRRRSPIT